MSEKKCSCERQMIAALIAGVILAVLIGFVLGLGWAGQAEELKFDSFVGLFSAGGTLVAAFGAVYTARVALGISDKEALNKEEQKQRQISAQKYVLWEWGEPAIDAVREILRAIKAYGQSDESWTQADRQKTIHAINALEVDSSLMMLGRIFDSEDFDEWVGIVARAGTVRRDTQRLLDVWDEPRERLGLWPIVLHDRADELLSMLLDNVTIVIRRE